MYERYYQLSAKPFRLKPDPNFCFSHSGYQRAREYLEYALDQGEGFVIVTGRPGTGKTLLLETFLREIDTRNVAAKRIALSSCSGEDLLRSVAYAYDMDAAGLDKATLRHRIHRYFIQQEQAGRRVLLIIDEAQALQHTALEELRILADLQTQSQLMLQLFLVGQNSLQDMMHAPDMEQFQQRVLANYHLVPLGLIETRAYIEYRLLLAGWNGDPEFTSAAVLAIYQLSKGVPRHINKICNRLLLLGYGKGCHVFDEEDVQTISAEMREEHLTAMESKRARYTVVAESITSIPEIRDGLISFDDLAIFADKMDANAFRLSEASRQAAIMKKQFIDRHHEDPAVWNVKQTSSADPTAEPVAMPVTEQPVSRFRKINPLAAMAAVLLIATISIAALPSIMGETAVKNGVSQAAHQSRKMQNTVAGGLPFSTDDVIAAVTMDTAGYKIVTDAGEDDVTTGMQDSVVPEEIIVLPADDRAVYSEETQLPENELPVAVTGITGRTETIDEYGPPSAGNLNRALLPQEERQMVVAGLMPTVSVADPVEAGHLEEIEQLLSKGQQSLDDFRLLLPEEDNAYRYFHAVLLLDPGNEAAIAGMQEIVDRYIALVKKATDRHENDRAKRYVMRGLSIQPDNRELLVLQDRIDRAIQSASAGTVTVARDESASLEKANSEEQSIPDSLIQGISTFFKNRQAEARSGVVRTPAGWQTGLDD